VTRTDGPDGSRSGLIASLLAATLVLAAALAWQAQESVRDHRAAAEKVLRDYAMLAADEFTRRTAAEVGFSGFFQLVTFLREAKAPLAPGAFATAPDEAVRKASDLVAFAFRYDASAHALEIAGPEPDAATRVWIVRELEGRAPSPPERRYETVRGNPGDVLRLLVLVPSGPDPSLPRTGFGADAAALTVRFWRALDKGALFPPSLARGRIGNEALSIRVFDPFGREVFRSGTLKEPGLEIERPFGSDYNGMLDGFTVRTAVDPAAAPTLVIGGLPRSRLPFLLGLFGLASGLIVVAGLQLRRERALARLRSDFVSRVSHELRTPLTQIRMFAETLLLERVRSDEEARRSLEIIDREARRLSNLVENVLRFSRGERGDDRIDARPRDVVPLVRQVVREFEVLSGGRSRIALAAPGAAAACTDEDALRQILLNLLDNAGKYGPAGQEIRVSVAAEGPFAAVSVEDEGPGIPAGERERVFTRFYRMRRDRDSAVAGTGIGLAIVRDLVRLHGGRVRIEGGPGRGARVVVELPAAAAPGEAP
jgi:signal transduction histidine kinase